MENIGTFLHDNIFISHLNFSGMNLTHEWVIYLLEQIKKYC